MLVPVVVQHSAAAAATLGTGSIYATAAYRPRPDDREEAKTWEYLNGDGCKERCARNREHVRRLDTKLATDLDQKTLRSIDTSSLS